MHDIIKSLNLHTTQPQFTEPHCSNLLYFITLLGNSNNFHSTILLGDAPRELKDLPENAKRIHVRFVSCRRAYCEADVDSEYCLLNFELVAAAVVAVAPE